MADPRANTYGSTQNLIGVTAAIEFVRSEESIPASERGGLVVPYNFNLQDLYDKPGEFRAIVDSFALELSLNTEDINNKRISRHPIHSRRLLLYLMK